VSRIGDLPASGQWVRFEVPASVLRIEDRQIDRIGFEAFGGHVWFDHVGKSGNACITPSVAAPTFPSGDTVWIDDNVPTGWSDTSWDTTQAAAGTRSIGSPYAQGSRVLFDTQSSTTTLPVWVGEKLVFYALLDPCVTTTEIVMYVHTSAGEMPAVYWGTSSGNGNEGMSVSRIGDLPATGQWVRFEVPASVLHIEDRQIDRIGFEAFGGHVWFDHVGKSGNACITPSVAAPTFPSGDTVWIDDNVPTGWSDTSWDTTQAAAGTRSIGSLYAQGSSVQFDTQGSTTLPVWIGEKLVFYTLLDPCVTTNEIVMFVRTSAGEWKGAYWGTSSGTEDGPVISMGALPATGQWVRMEIPASALRMEERQIDRIEFQTFGGQAWFDHVGKAGNACIPPAAAAPTFPSGDTVWIDDNVPSGWSDETWDTTQAASGTRSIGSWYGEGDKNTFDTSGSPTLPIAAGEKLVFYATVEECAPTNEIVMFIRTTAGDWVGAYWGSSSGTEDGPVIRIGDLPVAGLWSRFEVPASVLGVEDRQIDRIEFQNFAGHVWYDHVGKSQ
ncbi:MAG TPA: hypothetical protein VNG73_03250, partial [Gemmatimonadaceae bacterium]|nr:hypothetical protein [Gemmatimonadaceae bacterium]